jgi:hypothetical protein
LKYQIIPKAIRLFSAPGWIFAMASLLQIYLEFPPKMKKPRLIPVAMTLVDIAILALLVILILLIQRARHP